MARLIDADALIERLKFKRRLNGNIPDKCAGYDSAIAQANKPPSVDPVHAAGVCYCRECRNYNKPRLEWCSHHMDRENPDDFCSYGQLREGSQ